ncbi:hypothetical protein FGB62_9g48 [Gracilaria domingensis]|nr:hypothetical protein FGB62_9g48 [Gracilaria domingensis]
MRIRAWRCSSPFGPLFAASMRPWDERKGGWKTVRISEWLHIAAVRAPQRQMELFGEEGLLTVVLDGPHEAYALRKNNDALLKRFVREIVAAVNFDGRVDKLQVLVAKFYGEEGRMTANTAATLAAEAASTGGVRELTVSSSVFLAFEHIPLPETVDSVGVVDELVWSSFLCALPATLAALARRATLLGKRWYVWMQMMRLGHNVNALRRETLLRAALAACRRAERDGLCATGVRGTIEHWLRETSRRQSNAMYRRIALLSFQARYVHSKDDVSAGEARSAKTGARHRGRHADSLTWRPFLQYCAEYEIQAAETLFIRDRNLSLKRRLDGGIFRKHATSRPARRPFAARVARSDARRWHAQGREYARPVEYGDDL